MRKTATLLLAALVFSGLPPSSAKADSAEEPASVAVPGTHNVAMGCETNWAPDCAQATLELDPNDQVWKRTYPELPAGKYEYKAALNGGWQENYGAGGQPDGANIGYTSRGETVTFYYEHERHYVTSDAQGPIVTAPGSMQSELGCTADWDPACMASWLIDPDGDGIYSWTTNKLPTGNYELKVAHGLSWEENYGADAQPGGANIQFSVPRAGVSVQVNYELASHKTTITTSESGVAPDLKAAKAYWLTPELIAWPADEELASDKFRLHWEPNGALGVAQDGLGGSSVPLELDSAGLPDELREKYPHLAKYAVLRVPPSVAAKARQIVTDQNAVGRYGADGKLKDGTGIQLAGVLDSLYAGAAQQKLGVTLGQPATAKLWAPTARSVAMLVWDQQDEQPKRLAMARDDETGIWSTSDRLLIDGAQYLYDVEVFVPETGKVEHNLVTDPYSVGLTLNSKRSVIVDLTSPRHQPPGFGTSTGPRLTSAVDQTIYELHVRDFSIADESVPAQLRGSYLAFAYEGEGRKHLRDLANAGINTVHLLPTFDIATIEEDRSKQAKPDCDLLALAPDSEQQQDCIQAVADSDGFNWGYDPYHYLTPEGSYASTAKTAEGGQRSYEFRTMVQALHDTGLRVVLDQVFNHTAASGQNERSVLDKVVPGYYHRRSASGTIEHSTCCENVATEHLMAQKLMVDAVLVWAKDYRVDGFRFDLMGHHSRDNLLAIRHALNELTVEKDGVAGREITLYGEGWNFGEVANNARFRQAVQGQLAGTGVGAFNDRLRDGVRGGGPFDEDPRAEQGFATGGSSAHDLDLVQLGLAGNLKDFQLRSQESTQLVRGAQLDYNGASAGYAEQPDEVVNYVDAHDNETLFDAITFKTAAKLPMEQRIRLNTIALSTTALSQSISFWHAGADLLRSKSLDRDSYNSGDWFNLLDFSMRDNGFARGLPPAGKNKDKWPIMAPLLADPANKPTSEQIRQAADSARDLLKLRSATKLFRLGEASLIEQKVSFPVSGTELGANDVIVLRIDDTVGPDVDPRLDQLVAVFNASSKDLAQRVPGLEGQPLRLNEIQANGADSVVRRATWDAKTGTAHVPARSVAVFWLPKQQRPNLPRTGNDSDG